MRCAPRFSLGFLGVVVAVCAVAFAALRANSPLWADAMMTLAIGLLLAGVLAAAVRQGAARAFWVGFALVGWAYMVLAFGPWFEEHIKPHLLTTRLLEAASHRVLRYPAGAFRHYDNVWKADAVTGRWSLVASNVGTTFERTGHSLFALSLGLIGGALGRMLFAVETRSEHTPASPDEHR